MTWGEIGDTPIRIDRAYKVNYYKTILDSQYTHKRSVGIKFSNLNMQQKENHSQTLIGVR